MSLNLNGLKKKKEEAARNQKKLQPILQSSWSHTISSHISALGLYPLKMSRENNLTQVKCLHMMEIKEDKTWNAHHLTFAIHPVLAAIYSTIQLSLTTGSACMR